MPSTGRANHIVKHPCRFVVCLDCRLHVQDTTEHIAKVTIEALNVWVVVADRHRILVRVRIDKTRAEFDELSIHCIIHAGRITFEVRTCTFDRTFLVIVVKAHIISIIGTTTAKVHIVVLANSCLESLFEPVGICIIAEVIVAIGSKAVTARKRSAGVECCNAEVVAILSSVHQIILVVRHLVNTEIAFVIYLQGLILLTALRRDDHHTISST